MNYIEELTKYGLSEKQATIYLTLLKIGPSTANTIAEECDFVRTTTYDVLKVLKEEGIIGVMIKNKIKYFEAADPEKLIQLLDERKKYVNDILPQLKKLRTTIPEMPRSEIFEGKQGMKTVLQIILESKKPLYAYSNNKSMLDILPVYGPRFIKDRVKLKIPIKIISEPSKTTTKILKNKDKAELRETRTIPQFKDMALNQYFNEDFVAILGTREDKPIGIVIYHKDYAKAQKIIFDRLWINAEK
jgi:HTH-type transcriptional regulator, sugar sensing transcriptional regulator